jgi:predicted nucleic acid-binding protein
VLTDTGPLLALLDENDKYHAACVAIVRSLPNAPLVTTWLSFTEAIYFLGEAGGWHFQERLWKLRREGTLVLVDLTPAETDRMEVLMAQYQNVPMDAADAALVAVAESRGFRRLFSLDSDFFIYRLSDGSVLELLR